MNDNSEKPVLEFQITDLDSVWAPADPRGEVKILLRTSEACEVALKVPAETIVKLEAKLTKLREMQAKETGGRH